MRRGSLLLLAIFFLSGFSRLALADGPWDNKDPFNWNEEHTLHAVGSYALTFTMSQVLMKSGVSKFDSILISAASVFLAGVVKEVFCDDINSRGDTTANLIGVTAGTVMSIAIRF
jgi:hypothetical protein